MLYSKVIFLFLGIVICLHCTVLAQTIMKNSVLSNGCKIMYGSSNRIYSTLGQPVFGKSNNSNTFGYLGFWYQADILGITDVEQLTFDILPKEYSLKQNYPNPFNPTTIIKFGIPVRANVVIKIYDIIGSEVTSLLNQEKEAGWYELEFNADEYSSGIYIYRMQVHTAGGETGNFISTKKMLLIK